MAGTSEQATFAAGCFWGVEHYINKKFKGAILKSAVGYTGGDAANPKYQAVCSGATGHAEAVRFEFDPSKAKYADLVEYFYRIHDPTTPNRQGNDVGTQYRSAVFYHDDEQKRIAEEVTVEVQKKHYAGKRIATEIVPEQKWWDAEDYHQQYLVNNPGGYCNHFERW
ncbi:hypothetical protein WJX81_005294 [Elliptochloris bilobata]|uniref:peptide-methionine (S)-S-oxide reductase n=1 Tax=Elliptochloris bilobata TaxID=381761 RepID=A0AAW1RWX6_9CHLO